MTEPAPTKKKRGAQPGNRNARKHGFYASNFEDIELDDLEVLGDSELPALASEVALLRIWVRRMQAKLRLPEEGELEPDWIDSLNALGLACTRIATLLRVQKDLGGSQKEGVAALISQALTEITAEMKLS